MKLIQYKNTETDNKYVGCYINSKWKIIEDTSVGIIDILNLSEEEIEEKYKIQEVSAINPQQVLFPIAYRDFMLYEKHAINAAMGFAKKYLPNIYPIAKLYKKIFGKPVSKLRPSARYYKYPIYYMGNHLNIKSDMSEIKKPEYTEELDYELEIGAILSKPLKNASLQEASDAIGGYVILNDFSARDIQIDEMQAGFGPMKSKNFASSISNVIISKSSINERLEDLKVKVLINGEEIVSTNSKGKLYSFEEAIAYASWEEELHAGELFGSGTIPMCTGIENGRMLKPGDTIRLEVEELGSLTNTII